MTLLSQNNLTESKARRQQQLRSCLDTTEDLANKFTEKNTEKRVIELELNFDDKSNVDDIQNTFKGVHVIDSEFQVDNLTGKHFGKGKIKLRVDSRQEDIINKRLEQTPNLQAKKVDSGNYNKKCDYTGLSGSKWFSNALAQESKHFKVKEHDGKERHFNEFGKSSIFGDKEYNYNERKYDCEKEKDNITNWSKVKEYKDVKPRGYKPMGAIREGSSLLKSTFATENKMFKR